ncbi:MAG: HlyD family efflux transporter periplasmic adaptor subunit, partial [Pirellulales bacterium]
GGPHGRRHILTRYVAPGALLVGFMAVVAWASWDTVFPPREVTVVPVLTDRASSVAAGTPLFQAAGWIEPRPTPIRVAALAPGVVEQLLVVEDQVVAAGDPIAELVKDDARLSHDQALANVQLAESELAQAVAVARATTVRYEQPVHLEAMVADANAKLANVETQLANLPFETRRAEAQLQFAESNYQGKLSAKGAISDRLIEQARSELDAAQALVEELHRRESSLEREQEALTQQRNAQQRRLELLSDEIQSRDEAEARLNSAKARVELARVAAAEAKLRLDRMTVRSPVDGRVFELIGYPGSTLSGGMQKTENYDSSTVVTLYQPGKLQVRVDVRFEDIPKVSLGQSVTIHNPALDAPLSGNVLFLGSEADIQKNTLETKVAIDAARPVFKPQMLVDVTFLSPPRADDAPRATDELRIYVPKQLVHEGDGGTFVWLADQFQKVARRQTVETGAQRADGMVEIVRGLDVSSRLIAADHETLRDGERIRVVGEEVPQPRPSAAGHQTMQRTP